MINAKTIIDEAMIALANAPDSLYPHKDRLASKFYKKEYYPNADFLTFKTSERGHVKIHNCKPNIEAFIEKVTKNAKVFGGGIIKPKAVKTSKSKSWSATMIKTFKEATKEENYTLALECADKLDPIFYKIPNKEGVVLFVAPMEVPLSLEHKVYTYIDADGRFSTIEKGSMNIPLLSFKNRKDLTDSTIGIYNKLDECARISKFGFERTSDYTQKQARTEWMSARGLPQT